MAEGKKTIVVYSDWDEYFLDLTDQEAGKLIKHFFNYINDRNPELNDKYLEMAFKPIKGQLKRDLEKWEQTKKKRSDAGKLGGKASGQSRKQNEANEANASIVKQNEANEADNDICNNVLSDTVSVNVNEKDIIINNEIFSNECKISGQWIDVVAKSVKILPESIPVFLIQFNDHLIGMEEQKTSLKEYKEHFSNWIRKQDVSQFAVRQMGRTNQI